MNGSLFNVGVGSGAEGLFRAWPLCSDFALGDFKESFLFPCLGLLPIFCVQWLAVPNVVDGHVHPVPLASFIDHCPPFVLVFTVGDFFFGLPPSFPHARIRLTNSFLPHFLRRASALRFPSMLAALFNGLFFILVVRKLTIGI